MPEISDFEMNSHDWLHLTIFCTILLSDIITMIGFYCIVGAGIFLIIIVTALLFLWTTPGIPGHQYFRRALNGPFSASFPHPPQHFVGRDEDVKKLVDLIDFSKRTYKIICIVGSPGIGKSALAKAVGNEMILKGAVVHYVDMAEFPDGQLKQVLAEKIFQNLHEGSPMKVTFDKLLAWAGNRYWNNLIVLDNCDECINSQKQEFQDAIEQILSRSTNIKILTTSREVILYLDKYYSLRLATLDRASACELLEQRNPSVLNDTEKNLIAELTGDIPLALRIIGSLFSIEVPPTPAEIIEKLRENPIPTLSPEKLARKSQLNHSIMLSYSYLGSRLQKIARNLAHFPGSFDVPSAVSVLSHIFASEITADSSVNEMVMRSLLEYNKETRRYHFHRLVREFLLLHSENNETEGFNSAFRQHFTTTLCEMTGEFYDRDSPKNALTVLDTERHNFQYWMSTIKNPADDSIDCFFLAMRTKYLSSRFQPVELKKPIDNVIYILKKELISFRAHSVDADHKRAIFRLFVHFIAFSASRNQTLQEEDDSFQQFSTNVDIIEEFGHASSHSTYYVDFYVSFLSFYESKLDETSSKLYHERILRKNDETSMMCEISECDYRDIAYAYYIRNEFEKSIQFYEKALPQNNSIPVQLDIMMHLFYAYYLTRAQHEEKLLNMHEQLLSFFTQAINESSGAIYTHLYIYRDYYSMVIKCGCDLSKSELLLERIIDTLIDIGEKGGVTDIHKACELAESLYELKEYERATKVATYAVTSILHGYLDSLDKLLVMTIRHSEVVHILVKIQMVLSKSVYHTNRSEAKTRFVQTTEYLLANNFTVSYAYDFSQCCSYLFSLGNYKYLDVCYWPSVEDQITKGLETAMYLLFVMPFGPLETSTELPVNDLPIEQYPELIQHSKSTSLLYDDKKELLEFFSKWLLPVPDYNNYISRSINQLAERIFRYTLVRFFLNAVSFFVRLFLVYHLCKHIVKFSFSVFTVMIINYRHVVVLTVICIFILFSMYSGNEPAF